MVLRLRQVSRDAVRAGPAVAVDPDSVRRRVEEAGLDRALDVARACGRGAVSNPDARYEPVRSEAFDDGWNGLDEPEPLATEVTIEKARTVITRNDSPDIGFDRSLNPYRGCEHGCIYCFARPTHAYQGLSPGLDFETKLFAKAGAAELLEKELAAPGYVPKVLALGTNTDPYQPIERRFRITRGVLEILQRSNHPVGIVTKSSLITRDIDILAAMAERRLVKVAISVTTLDPRLARRMEPRAPTPMRRLDTIRRLAEAGIPVNVLVAPIVPALTDHEIEDILAAAHAAGAREAGYVLLRMPREIEHIVRDWLGEHYPDKQRHVFTLVQDAHGGRTYDPSWGKRMTGAGPYAWMIGRRFESACRRIGFEPRRLKLRTDLFAPPLRQTGQLSLF